MKDIYEEAQELSYEQLVSMFRATLEHESGLTLEYMPLFVKTTGHTFVTSWANSFEMEPCFEYGFGFYWYKREDVIKNDFKCYILNKGCSCTSMFLYMARDDPLAKANVLLKAALFEVGIGRQDPPDSWYGKRFMACEHLYRLLGHKYSDYHHAMSWVLPSESDLYKFNPPNSISELMSIFASQIASTFVGWVPAVVTKEGVSDDVVTAWVDRTNKHSEEAA